MPPPPPAVGEVAAPAPDVVVAEVAAEPVPVPVEEPPRPEPPAAVIRVTPPLLLVDRPAAPPGSRVTLTGDGCDAAAAVTIEIDGRRLGTAMSDESGRFSVTLSLPDLRVGRHRLIAVCGPTLETSLDVVLVTLVDRATTSLALLAFFVLLALAVIRRQLDHRPRRR